MIHWPKRGLGKMWNQTSEVHKKILDWCRQACSQWGWNFWPGSQWVWETWAEGEKPIPSLKKDEEKAWGVSEIFESHSQDLWNPTEKNEGGGWREDGVGEERVFSFVVVPQDCAFSHKQSKELSHLVLKFKQWFYKESKQAIKLATGEWMQVEMKSCLQLILSVEFQAILSFFSFLL